jgi:integrase
MIESDSHYILLWKKLELIKKERNEHNITFHSWRHFLNSMLINANIPDQKVKSMTGHSTNEMTEHYYHPDEMKDVIMVQERLLALKQAYNLET